MKPKDKRALQRMRKLKPKPAVHVPPKPALKPCKQCKGKPVQYQLASWRRLRFFVQCEDCGRATPPCALPSYAVAVWNNVGGCGAALHVVAVKLTQTRSPHA